MVAQYKASNRHLNDPSSAAEYIRAMSKELAAMAYTNSLAVAGRCLEMAATAAERDADLRRRNTRSKRTACSSPTS